MKFKGWFGHPSAPLENLKLGMAMSRDTVDKIILEAIQVEDNTPQILHEIEGTDGYQLDRGQIEDLIKAKRIQLSSS